ncbi:MAG: hypothetical protein NXY57DRAFT_1043939, partial [Lentinula lateritia]
VLATNEGNSEVNSEVAEERVSQNTNNDKEADRDDTPIYSEGNRNRKRVGTTEQDEAVHSSGAQVNDTDASGAQSFIDETDSGWTSRVETDDTDGNGFRDDEASLIYLLATSEAENASDPAEAEDNLEDQDDTENFFDAGVTANSSGFDLPPSNRKKSKKRDRVTPQVVGAASSSVEENLPITAASPNYAKTTPLHGIAARKGSVPSTPPLKRKKAESHSDLDGIEISEVSPALSKRHRRADTESPSRIPTKATHRFIDLSTMNPSNHDSQSHSSKRRKPDVDVVPLPRPKISKSKRNTSETSKPAPASARPQQKTFEVTSKPERNSYFTPAPIRQQQNNTFARPRRAEDGNNGHAKVNVNKVTRGIQEENSRRSQGSSSSIVMHESDAEASSNKSPTPSSVRTTVPKFSRSHSVPPSSRRIDTHESNAKASSSKIAASSSVRTVLATSSRSHSFAPYSIRTPMHESDAEVSSNKTPPLSPARTAVPTPSRSHSFVPSSRRIDTRESNTKASSSKIAASSSVRTAVATSSRNNSFAALNRNIFTTPPNSRATKHPRIEDESDEDDQSPPRHITKTKKSSTRK